MSDYVYCECRTNDSYDLSLLGQPFEVTVEYENASDDDAWVHLNVSNFGDRPAVAVPAVNPADPRVKFTLPNYVGDTQGVVMRARIRDTNDPDPSVGTTLFAEEEQTGILFCGLGMGVTPELSISPKSFSTSFGTFYYKRFPPQFDEKIPFPFMRVLVYGKPLGRSPVLRYDLPAVPVHWVQVRGKWGLEYMFTAPDPLILGANERPLATALLLDSNHAFKGQTPVVL